MILLEGRTGDVCETEMTSLRRESTITFDRQLTTTSFGRQSTFDTIDEQDIVLTDEEKRKRQKIFCRGILFLALGFMVVVSAAGALGVMTYFNKKTWTKTKDIRYGVILDFTTSEHMTLDVFELFGGKNWIHLLHRTCSQEPSENLVQIKDCFQQAEKIIPAESINETPIYIINNTSIMSNFFNTSKFQIMFYLDVSFEKRLQYHWLAQNHLSKKKPISLFKLTDESLQYVVPILEPFKSASTVNAGQYLLYIKNVSMIELKGVYQSFVEKVKQEKQNDTETWIPCFKSSEGDSSLPIWKSLCQHNKTDNNNTTFKYQEIMETKDCMKHMAYFISYLNAQYVNCDDRLPSSIPLKNNTKTQVVIVEETSNAYQSNDSRMLFGPAFVTAFTNDIFEFESNQTIKMSSLNMKTRRIPWTHGWIIEKYWNATMHDGNINHVLSPVIKMSYNKISNVIFVPSAVLFSCILMIGLILVIIGNAHL